METEEKKYACHIYKKMKQIYKKKENDKIK